MTSTDKITIVALLLATLPLGLKADAFGYSATSNTPYSYVNIAGTGASVLAGDDDSSATLALPFGFRFYGTNYSSLCVSTNGLISFGSCVPGDFTNLDLTAQSPAGNQPLIAPFWMDLTFSQPGSGSIVYQTLGTAPNRQFVIQWNNVTALNSPGTLNFQTILFETTSDFSFQYQSVETGSAAVSKGASATVGIRGPSGNSNGNRTQWSFRVPVLKNGLAIKFNSAFTVSIDIKPGASPNVINLGSKGTIPVAIFSSPTFDVTQADPSTMRLSGAPVAQNGPGKWQVTIEDVNGDGLKDILAHFQTEGLQLTPADTQATVQGRTTDGRSFRGVDSVQIVK